MDISKYIKGFGNVKEGFCFIAIWFQKSTIWVSKHKPLNLETDKYLILSKNGSFFDNNNNKISGHNNRQLLIAYIQSNCNILKCVYWKGVLYCCFRGSFPLYCKKIRKGAAFNALYVLTLKFLQDEFLDLQDCSLSRFFKRQQKQLYQWTCWYPFVHSIMDVKFINVIGSYPTTFIASLVYKILKISNETNLTSPVPRDFYTCELTFEDSLLLGIVFKKDYISPMVVSFQNRLFMDVNRVECNQWLPLYRNKHSWLHLGGMKTYLSNLKKNRETILMLEKWLATKNVEKYQYMLQDLKCVKQLLFL